MNMKNTVQFLSLKDVLSVDDPLFESPMLLDLSAGAIPSA
ncbi:hypothetical protein CLU91_1474 [Janthinobacterium sp. 64]|nr:hypothetical protein CLU91_1474 [Janthinobacterium sp. 64]